MAADQAGGMAVSGVPPGYAVPPIGGTILPGGTAPPMGGTVSCCLSAAWHDACFCRHDVMPSIDGTVSRRRIRRRKSGAGQPPGTASGGGRSGIPNGMPQGTPTGIPAGTAGSGGIPAPPTGAASTGGRFLGTPMGVLCEPPGTVPSIDGTVCGAGYCRHGMVPPGTVPPIGGTVSPGDGKARDGRVRRGLAGTLEGVPRSRAVDRLHCSRPAGRRMRALRDFNVAIWGNVSMSGAAYVSWAPCGTACLAVGVSVPPSRPCPLIPRLLVRKLGFWRPALPAPRVPCPDPRCPGTVQEPRASSRHGRPRNGLGHAPTRKSAEPAASVACLQ